MTISALDTIFSTQTEYGSNIKTDETGMDTFLTLLVAQLKHQDPLNPMEGSEFAVQLAQFTSIEQQFKTNDYLEDIAAAALNQESGDLFGYLGRTVKTDDNTVYAQNGNVDPISYNLDDRAEVTVTITDAYGSVVRRIYEDWQDEGAYTLSWNGKNDAGNKVADGAYTFKVDAVDEGGSAVSHQTYVTGEVTGVTYQGGVPYLMIGGQLVSPSTVIEVTLTQPSADESL